MRESSLVLFLPDQKSFEKPDFLLEKGLSHGTISLWSPLITFANHSFLCDSNWERITFIPNEYELIPDREFIVYNNSGKKYVFNHFSLRRISPNVKSLEKTVKTKTIADEYISNANSIDNFDPQNDWNMGDVDEEEDLEPRESTGSIFANYSADTDKDTNPDKEFCFLTQPIMEDLKDDNVVALDCSRILREQYSFSSNTPATTTNTTPNTSQKLSTNTKSNTTSNTATTPTEPLLSENEMNATSQAYLQYEHIRKFFEDFPIATGKESFAIQHVLQRCALDIGNMNLVTQQTAMILSIWIGSISENNHYLSLDEMIRKELLQLSGSTGSCSYNSNNSGSVVVSPPRTTGAGKETEGAIINASYSNWILSFLLDCFIQYPIQKYFSSQLIHDYTIAKELLETYCNKTG